MRQLTIEPEFRDKIPPLTEDEFKRLEENILEDGEVREPLVIWENTIIDGHHRWRIIQAHPELEGHYQTKDMNFSDKWEAIAWMCKNQLGRRNLLPKDIALIRQEMFDARSNHERCFQGNQYTKSGEVPVRTSPNIAKQMSNELGVSVSEIKHNIRYGRGLKRADKISPGIKDKIQSGELNASMRVVEMFNGTSDETALEAVAAIERGDIASAKEIMQREKAAQSKTDVDASDRVPKLQKDSKTETDFSAIEKCDKDEEDDEEYDAEYNLDDFRGELMAVVRNLDAGLNQHLVLTHREMLDDEKWRKAACDVMVNAENVIGTYMRYVDGIGKGGEYGKEWEEKVNGTEI